MDDIESAWIQQARAGDAVAFSQLVEAYQAPVYNLAYRMLGNRVEAEDAAQETFIRAYTRLGTYDPGRKFSSWLLAIASHYCVDVLRKRRVHYVSLDDLPPMVELAMPPATRPEQVVVNRQDASAVQELLDGLKPAYRTPVILRYWYDMSYQEIAETMGVSLGTIKTRLHRARAQLARLAAGAEQGAVPQPTPEGTPAAPKPDVARPRTRSTQDRGVRERRGHPSRRVLAFAG
jgi:RNA polymerase sigma-70 factor (ECF subfamily)